MLSMYGFHMGVQNGACFFHAVGLTDNDSHLLFSKHGLRRVTESKFRY